MRGFFHFLWRTGCLILFLIWQSPVQGHGGGVLQLFNAEAGPYWVSVWTAPKPLQTGKVHITVAVVEPPEDRSQPEQGKPVLGATVQLLAQAANGVERIETVATHEQAVNKFFYEADLELETVGMWQFEITVSGALGQGVVQFEQTVSSPSAAKWIFTGVAGLAILLGGWLWYARTSRLAQMPARSPQRRSL